MTTDPDYQWTKQGYNGDTTFMIVHDLLDGEKAYEAVVIDGDNSDSETTHSEKDAKYILNQWCEEHNKWLNEEDKIYCPQLKRLKH